MIKWEVGEPVEIYRDNWEDEKIWCITQISKVYKDGRFKLLYSSHNFRNNGTPITKDKWYKHEIVRKASIKTRNQIYRHITVHRCNKIIDLDFEQAKRINELFDELNIPKVKFYGNLKESDD